jgi:Dolichyl-phosphate-mannose-protein mannosyltransferase
MSQGTASTASATVGVHPEADDRKALALRGSRTRTTSLASVNLLWIAAALFMVGVALRLHGIDTQSLWTDDGFSLDYSTCDQLAACLRHITSGHSSEQFDILYFVILHLWRDVFGDSTVSLRALSVIASILALPLIWSAAAALFGRATAAWSLALSATSGFAIFYAHDVRPYAFLVLVSSLQLWLLTQARVDGARGYWKYLFMGASFIASWSSIFCLLFTVALAVGDILAHRQWLRSLKWWLPIGIACIPAALYYVVRVLDAPPELITAQKSNAVYLNLLFVVYGHLVGQTFSVPLIELRGTERWSMLMHHWGEFALLAATCALLLSLGVHSIRNGGWAGRRGCGVRSIAFSTAAFVGLCLLVAIATEQNWLPRHAFALHVLLVLLLPAATSSPGMHGRTRQVRAVALSGLVLLNLWSLKNYYYEPAHWRDDYRGVASYLQEQRREGRPAVMLLGKVSVLRHYGDDQTLDGTSFDRSLMPLQIRAATGDAKEVLVVVNREFSFESEDRYVKGWKPRRLVVSMMSPQYKLISTEKFQYFTVYRFSLAG